MSNKLLNESDLRECLLKAFEKYKQTPAYNRNDDCMLMYISLSDMATDLAPLLLEEINKHE